MAKSFPCLGNFSSSLLLSIFKQLVVKEQRRWPKKVAVQNRTSIKSYEAVSLNDILIQALLTTVHTFLCPFICTLFSLNIRTAIR